MTQSNFVPSGEWKSSAGSVSRSMNQYNTNFLLGTLNFRTISTTHRYSDVDGTDDADNSTTTKTFLVKFHMGFTTCRKGFRFMMTSTFDRYALDVVRRRPNDSEIFELCIDGNVQAVKRFLDRGEASIHDVDEDGESLLHKAVIRDNKQLCTMLLDFGADVYWKDDYGIFPISRASSLTCFAAISEAGFDFWSLYASRPPRPFFPNLSISVWRYVFQHKSAQSIEGNFILVMPCNIIGGQNVEVVDFLVARFAKELFQLGTFESYHSRNLVKNIIFTLFKMWLGSLMLHWFSGKDEFKVFLFEHKLTLILRQALMPSFSRESNKELLLRAITGIYIDGVLGIIKRCLWSVEITNAMFRIWSKPFFELGIDLFSHHPSTESDGQENNDEGSIGENKIAKRYFKGHFIHCCKDINYSIVREHQQDTLSLDIDVTILPEYSHLDPLFLCEAGRQRCDRTGVGRCLSRIDETFIKDGKFSMDIPGQWEEPIVPNTTMELVLDSPFSMHPQICYSMIHGSERKFYKPVTEEDIQWIEEDLRNGTLYGLSEDSPEMPGRVL
ncbi:uncharacterized protein EAF01_011864 [Botrytis porri]|uniref:uncharacterized protein n=1 Tax=Botrytis porri TaxID=87229 RepID=UPI0019011A6E|nr:uncharacterized protein EAF01_011864 [Botrytis porri]KAF7881353.1 hypothetical protein EAF01_011864 [Botrytis porri]